MVAEWLGTILIPVMLAGMIVSVRYAFEGGDWECSGDGCLEEFDRLRGWTFPVPLFAMLFLSTFGFVGAILLRLYGRAGKPATFEPKQPKAIPALRGVAFNLMWAGMLEVLLGGAFAWAGQWVVGFILSGVGIMLILSAWRTTAKAERSDRILRSGVTAIGEITEVERTGSSLNNNPELKLTLTIHQDGVPVFPVVHREYVPHFLLSRIQVGARLPVKVDPLDSNNIAIEWNRAPHPGEPAAKA